MSDYIASNQSINIFNAYKGFRVEFYGYNLTTSGIVKKLYIKGKFEVDSLKDKQIILDDRNINLISHALSNKFLSAFNLERYSLFDISLRELGSIGFSFNDLKDSSYIEPKQIFKPFVDFENQAISDIVKKIQDSIFLQQPQYNPVFMIGLIIDDIELVCIKAYIRFDLAEAATSVERMHIVERIVKVINQKVSCVNYFSNIVKQFESIGFIFSFVGVDCDINDSKRFKLYFRFYGENNFSEIVKKLTLILSGLGLYNGIQEIFNQHSSGIWGIAVSTDTFECIDGIQLYFYP